MIVASFLVKHLLIDWRLGQAWFWDTLVDADLANNAASWQWVAGCGADAAPFFRIFNPVLQGQKFDPDGAYVHRYVPELARSECARSARYMGCAAGGAERGGHRTGPDLSCADRRSGRKDALRALAAFAGAAPRGRWSVAVNQLRQPHRQSRHVRNDHQHDQQGARWPTPRGCPPSPSRWAHVEMWAHQGSDFYQPAVVVKKNRAHNLQGVFLLHQERDTVVKKKKKKKKKKKRNAPTK